MAGSSSPSDQTTSFMFPSASRATTCCMTRITARSAASTLTAPAPKWWRLASATRWASTGIRKPSSSTSLTTAGTGCRKIFLTMSSTGSPRSVSISVRRIAGRATSPIPNTAGAIPAASSRLRSWNRTNKFGGDVVVAHLNKDGTVKNIEPIVTGFLQDNKYVGRPVDVMQMKDGSLLISDDWNGAVWRLSYGKQKVAGQ